MQRGSLETDTQPSLIERMQEDMNLSSQIRSLCTWLEEETHYLTDCNIKSAKVFVSQSRHIHLYHKNNSGTYRGDLKYHGFLYFFRNTSIGSVTCYETNMAKNRIFRLVRPSEGLNVWHSYDEILWSKVKQWLNLMWMVFSSGNTIDILEFLENEHPFTSYFGVYAGSSILNHSGNHMGC